MELWWRELPFVARSPLSPNDVINVYIKSFSTERVYRLGDASTMAKMKGIFKGMKYITQIFVVKDQEMEIGYPTDVKHVAHVGWDNNASANGPSWMNDFKTTTDVPSKPSGHFGGQSREPSWASQDFEQPRGLQQPLRLLSGPSCQEIPKGSKKTRRKKSKVSPPTSSSMRSTSRTFMSRSAHEIVVEEAHQVQAQR